MHCGRDVMQVSLCHKKNTDMKTKIYYFLQLSCMLAIFGSCKKDNFTSPGTGLTVTAFSMQKITDFAPMRVQLTNLSTPADSYRWTIAETGQSSTAADPEFLLTRKGTYTIKLESTRAGIRESTTQEVVVKNDPAMQALYLFSNNWVDSSDYGNNISGGHGLLRADPDRKNNAKSCINMGTMGGALFFPDNLIRNTGTATTISMWVNANTVIRNPLLGYWKGDEPQNVNIPSIYFDDAGKLRLKFANGTVAPQITVEGLAADTWYHIVLTGNGVVQQAYVNGVLAGTVNSDPINHGLMNSAGLGYMYVPNNSTWGGLNTVTWTSLNFKGFFDDVRIYNKMLSEKEVKALFEE